MIQNRATPEEFQEFQDIFNPNNKISTEM